MHYHHSLNSYASPIFSCIHFWFCEAIYLFHMLSFQVIDCPRDYHHNLHLLYRTLSLPDSTFPSNWSSYILLYTWSFTHRPWTECNYITSSPAPGKIAIFIYIITHLSLIFFNARSLSLFLTFFFSPLGRFVYFQALSNLLFLFKRSKVKSYKMWTKTKL